MEDIIKFKRQKRLLVILAILSFIGCIVSTSMLFLRDITVFDFAIYPTCFAIAISCFVFGLFCVILRIILRKIYQSKLCYIIVPAVFVFLFAVTTAFSIYGYMTNLLAYHASYDVTENDNEFAHKFLFLDTEETYHHFDYTDNVLIDGMSVTTKRYDVYAIRTPLPALRKQFLLTFDPSYPWYEYFGFLSNPTQDSFFLERHRFYCL